MQSEGIVVITGATSGIGLSSARLLSSNGFSVYLVARRQEALSEAIQTCRSLGAKDVDGGVYDLVDDASLQQLADTLKSKSIRAIIHSAGVCDLGTVENTSAEVLDRNWAVNLRAPYIITSKLMSNLKDTSGQVLFINSGAGQKAKAGWSAYAASKHGLKALADSLRDEVGHLGIRVTSIFPGRTATPMQIRVREIEQKDYVAESYVRPDDVALVVLQILNLQLPSSVDDVSIRPYAKA